LIEALGELSYLHLDQPGGVTLVAKAAGNIDVAIGTSMAFSVPSASCHLFTVDGFAVAPLAPRPSISPFAQESVA